MNKPNRILCLLLSAWLSVFVILSGESGVRAADNLDSEAAVQQTGQVTEAEDKPEPEETLNGPEETSVETEPSQNEPVETAPAAEEEEENQMNPPVEGSEPENVSGSDPTGFFGEESLSEEEDDWLFTLTDNPAVTSEEMEGEIEPTQTGFRQFAAENKVALLLAALVFALFGAGTCWLGKCLGGLKFLLRFRGIKTSGILTRADWDALNRGYRCAMTYQLENGRTIESEWPTLQHGWNPQKNLGKSYPVYYHPEKPKEYDCAAFTLSKLPGILAILMGLFLILAALAAACCVVIV